MQRLPRREFLYGLGTSLGAVAFSSLLQAEDAPVSRVPSSSFRLPPFKPKAKAVIMLFMEGGPSQADTFDPKPKLNELHLSESTRTKGLATGKRFYVGSPFKSRKVGNSGIEMCDQWQFLADPEVADELCIYRGCQAESLNHPEALLHMNTGSRLGGGSRSGLLGHLRAGVGEPESSWLRGDDRARATSSGSRQLDQRFPACSAPGDPATLDRLAHPRPQSPRIQVTPAPAEGVGSARDVERWPCGQASGTRGTASADGKLRIGIPDANVCSRDYQPGC